MITTLPNDYARNLRKLADSIDRAPESPDIRAAWIAALIDTCPLSDSALRRCLFTHLEYAQGESPLFSDTPNMLRALSQVIRRVLVPD